MRNLFLNLLFAVLCAATGVALGLLLFAFTLALALSRLAVGA